MTLPKQKEYFFATRVFLLGPISFIMFLGMAAYFIAQLPDGNWVLTQAEYDALSHIGRKNYNMQSIPMFYWFMSAFLVGCTLWTANFVLHGYRQFFVRKPPPLIIDAKGLRYSTLSAKQVEVDWIDVKTVRFRENWIMGLFDNHSKAFRFNLLHYAGLDGPQFVKDIKTYGGENADHIEITDYTK